MADDDRSDSAPDAQVDATDTVGAEGSAPRLTTLLAYGRWVFFLATAIGWGALLGLIFWKPWATVPALDSVPAAHATTARPDPSIAPDEPLHRQTAMQRLKAADRLLASGSLGSALEHYARIWKNPPLPRPYDHLLYRIAVARELVGNPEEALAHYQDIVRVASSERVAAAAQLGQARIWLTQGKFRLATAALCDLAFHPEIANYPDDTLAGWRAHLFAMATARQASGHKHASRFGNVFDDEDCVAATPNFDGQDLLRLPIPAKVDTRASIKAEVAVLYQFGTRPEEIQVRLSTESQSLLATIESLLATTDSEVSWNEAAKKRCAVRTKPAITEGSSLAMLLDFLLIPVDLVWSFQDERIVIRDPAELAQADLAEAMWQRAERAARLASTRYAGHRLAPFVYLSVGNAAFRRSEFEAAEASYRQLLQLPPSSPTRTEATFNLAKTLRNSGRHQDALQMFYRAADVGQGHPLCAAAYAFAGRLHIESGEINEAIRPLMRAASLAEDDVAQQISAVTLAAAYLLSDNPHAANTGLMRFREALAGRDFEGVAALVSSLARLQVSEGTDRLRHGRALITALEQAKSSDFFGDFGHLLIGRACETTGLLQQMVEVYQAALQTDLPDWLRNETTIALATHQIETARYDQAQRLLTELLEGPNEDVSERALIELARIWLRQERVGDCLTACQDLLQRELAESQKSAVLVLMGKAHQARSEHYEAALCFAGMIPGGNRTSFEMPLENGETSNRMSPVPEE